MTLPIITATGNLTADPELKFLPSGKAVVNIRIACSDRYFDKQTSEWKDSDPCFISGSAWGNFAENIANSVSRGDPVVLTGKLMEDHWQDKDGVDRSRFNVKILSLGPDLNMREAKPVRVERTQGTQGGDPWQAQQAPAQQAQQQQRPPQQAQQWPAQQGRQQGYQTAPQQGLQGTPWGQTEQSRGYDEPPF